MRVSLVTSVPLAPPWDQGDKNLAYALTRALPQVSFDVLTAWRLSTPTGNNLEPHPLFRSLTPSLLDKANVYRWLLLGATENPDLYHLLYKPYPLSSLLSRRLPAYGRRPILHTVTCTSGKALLDRRVLFADRVVSISEWGRKRLLEAGIKKVDCIPPGIPVDDWEAVGLKSRQLKAGAGLSDQPVILFPGHYGPGQGAGVMLEALPRVLDRCREARFIFACRLRSSQDRRREASARAMVNRLGLGGSVIFYNTVEDMSALIGACDLLVLPLQTMLDKMDLPITLLEAMAAGKPVVITDIPPMNELICQSVPGEETPAGISVPQGDPIALSEAMLRLLGDEELRHAMGARAKSLVLERYDIRQMAQKYEEIYTEMTHA